MTTPTTTPTTPLILTADQHAQLRDHLSALMEYAAIQRDCRPNTDPAELEAAHTAAMAAAEALDLLNTALADMTKMIAVVPEWASRMDGSVKH